MGCWSPGVALIAFSLAQNFRKLAHHDCTIIAIGKPSILSIVSYPVTLYKSDQRYAWQYNTIYTRYIHIHYL